MSTVIVWGQIHSQGESSPYSFRHDNGTPSKRRRFDCDSQSSQEGDAAWTCKWACVGTHADVHADVHVGMPADICSHQCRHACTHACINHQYNGVCKCTHARSLACSLARTGAREGLCSSWSDTIVYPAKAADYAMMLMVNDDADCARAMQVCACVCMCRWAFA